MPVTVEPVRSRRDFNRFISLPNTLYAGMPGFVPALEHERREMLAPRKAAFFAHGEAQYWLAFRDGRAVGRISAQIDRLTADAPGGPPGLFGCLDAADDAEAVAALLETAAAWLRGKGCVSMTGPYLLSINGESGLLLEGQDQPPMVMMPWHPAYLAELLRRAGYDLVKTLESFVIDPRAVDDRWLSLAESVSAGRARVRGLRKHALAQEAEVARMLFNDAWQHNWGFVPLVEADTRALVRGFGPFLFEDCAVVAEVDGRPVGLALGVPNISEITAGLGGRPSPLGWLRLLWRIWRRRYRSGRILLFGMATEYRMQKGGTWIVPLIIAEMIRRGRRLGLQTIEAGWVLDDNMPVLRILRAVGFRRVRVYGVFAKTLT
jgi:hypothetical protein